MTWILLALLAMFLWASSNLLDKYIFSHLNVSATIGWYSGLVGVFIAALVPFFWPLSFPSMKILILGLISGVLYSAGIYSYIVAIKHDDISKLIALFNFIPILVAVFAAVFLGEIFTPWIYVAILFMVIGAILISADVDKKIRFTKGFWLIMLSVVFFATSNVMDKYLLEFIDVPTLFSIIRYGFFLTLIPFLPRAFKEGSQIYRESPKYLILLIISSLLGLTGFLSLYHALTIGYVTLIESLTAFQPLFVLTGAFIFSKHSKKLFANEFSKDKLLLRLFAITLLMIGCFIVISA